MADQKLTDLSAVVTPVDADLVYTVTDVATTATSKKATWTVVKAFLKTYFDGIYGNLVSPSFTTPTIGVATATSINKVAVTAPATSATLTIDNGFTLHCTGNVTALSGSSTGSNTGDQTLPVKATATELDTGTDDAKFATALGIKNAHNVPSVAPGTSGNVLTSNGTDWTSATPAASASFWTLMLGTPTRVGNTSFTVTGDYTSLIAKGMIIKWTESATVRTAMVSIPSTYGAPNTTITIVGDTMASIDASSLKYALIGAEGLIQKFVVAGTIGATGTDVANAYYATEPMRVIAADLQTGTAGTTNSTTVDVNKAGTTMFTTKPTLATTVASSPTPFSADSATSLALGDKVTLDIDAIQTTAAIDLYVQLYLYPTRYLNL